MANNSIKTIKTDLSKVGGSGSTFFTGVDDLITNARLDPFVNGYSFVRVIDVPAWFQKDQDLKYFKDMINKNSRSFSGVSPIELQTGQMQTGFPGHEVAIATGITRSNTEFTIGHKEYSGGVMRKLYQKYISYIRDPRTGIAMYPSVFETEYGAANHTCTILYMTVRPDILNKKSDNLIEYACFYSNAFPTNVPLDELYNYEGNGQQDSPSISISWRGFPEIGPDVEAYALKVLREDILNVSENGNGIPFVDSYGFNKEAVALQNTGSLKDIFNSGK